MVVLDIKIRIGMFMNEKQIHSFKLKIKVMYALSTLQI